MNTSSPSACRSFHSRLVSGAALLLGVLWGFESLAAPPLVSNIRVSQRPGTQLVDVLYNVSDPDGNSPLKIAFFVSADGGTNYSVPVFTYSGAVGPNVLPGNDRSIVWNAGLDWPGRFSASCRVRILADDGTTPPAPTGMVYIPAGAFQMGDNFHEIGTDTLPVHNVFISAFFMDRYEVTRELYSDVYSWALARGYSMNIGSSGGPNQPIQSIQWYEAVKWCNARSEKEGLNPVYYTDAFQTNVYRSGNLDLTNACVKWTANGYRLPTEAEWEKAARGGLQGKRYPWGDTISGSQANYASSGDAFEASSGATPVGYYNGSQTPAGTNMANGYGLYDMAGNIMEMCWDVYDGTFYGKAPATSDNTHGPDTRVTTLRISRGGAWAYSQPSLRCAYREALNPGNALGYYGFRCVKGF